MDRIKIGPKELSKLLGISENLLYRWRTCERSISEEHLEALVKISNGALTMDELVGAYASKIRRKRKQYRLERDAERAARAQRNREKFEASRS